MHLIGINGRMHSGKDTAYEILQKEYPALKFRRVGFADKLKLSAAIALGFRPNSVEEAVAICNRLKENGQVQTRLNAPAANLGDVRSSMSGEPSFACITGREYLQGYGMEAHRDVFGEDFWVDVLLPITTPLHILFPDVDVLVVTDVRFENEADRILEFGGHVWQLDAHARLGPLPSGSHVSELGLPDEFLTNTVDNNRSLDEFERNVLEVFESVPTFDRGEQLAFGVGV